MSNWFFPHSFKVEGLSNPGLEMFKGEPIRAMAREVCQNSLDAKLDENRPLRVEFQRYFIRVQDFPGIIELRETLIKCREFWKDQGDNKTRSFIDNAIKTISGEKFFVLRISDYNTTGLRGAYSKEVITPWKSLVQGDAFSIKSTESAAGSFGIGKAAPFVVSQLQTVFYRTFDVEYKRATQGVTHLVSFSDDLTNFTLDNIHSSTGYFCDGEPNKPYESIPALEKLHQRNEFGTDLFVPCFDYSAAKSDDWKDDIIIEVLENFLYAIFSGKMEVVVDGKVLNKDSVGVYVKKYLPKTKNADSFLRVIENNERVVKVPAKNFYNMGELRLRLLYYPDAVKKVLVVRNSGMKIADIPSLPKAIPFVGFLELCGTELNKFFRLMENPQHNKWEPNRHPDKERAKRFKDEVEEWVRQQISEKIKEISGEELDIEVDAFFAAEKEQDDSGEKRENIVDKVKETQVIPDKPVSKNFMVKDIGGAEGRSNNRRKPGKIDDEGSETGHRTPTGKRKAGNPTGRKGIEQQDGEDSVYDRMHEVEVSARIIKCHTGVNKLIFVAKENISQGELEIVTVGENGKSLRLNIKTLKGINVNACLQNGHIVISNVEMGIKNTIEFEIYGDQNYAMGVRAYGN